MSGACASRARSAPFARFHETQRGNDAFPVMASGRSRLCLCLRLLLFLLRLLFLCFFLLGLLLRIKRLYFFVNNLGRALVLRFLVGAECVVLLPEKLVSQRLVEQ